MELSEYSSNKNRKRTKKTTKTTETVQTSSQSINPQLSSILAGVDKFFVNFTKKQENKILSDNEDDLSENQNDEIQNQSNKQKLEIKRKTFRKIFNKMLNLTPQKITSYIIFVFSYVESESVTNTISTFIVDYKTVMHLVNCFYVQITNKKNKKDDDEEDEIILKMRSLNKIFNLLKLPNNQRLGYLQFFEVDEDIEYEEENIKLTKKSNKIIPKIENSKYHSKKKIK